MFPLIALLALAGLAYALGREKRVEAAQLGPAESVLAVKARALINQNMTLLNEKLPSNVETRFIVWEITPAGEVSFAGSAIDMLNAQRIVNEVMGANARLVVDRLTWNGDV